MDFIAVALGGALGAVSRYALGLIPLPDTSGFPLCTFLINVVACLLIGFIATAFEVRADLDKTLLLFLKTGFCGGFSTYSTFGIETTTLIDKGSYGVAGAYVVLTIVICCAAVYAGSLLARAIIR